MGNAIGAERQDRRPDVTALAEELADLDVATDVAVAENLENARHRPACPFVDRADASPGDRTGHQDRMDGVGYDRVRPVDRGAGDLEAAIDARRRGPDGRVGSKRIVHRLDAHRGSV